MEKILFSKQSKISFLIFLIFINKVLLSQAGKDCYEPYVIESLPFYYSGTTENFFNDYTNQHACNSVYMSGEDFVFSYTPTEDIKININTSNTTYLVGLFVLNGCPDDPNTICRAKVEAYGGNPKIEKLQLYKDTTYYIIIDTYNAANLFPYTTFSIEIIRCYNYDIGPVWIYRPRSGCHHSNKTQVTILYHNFGTEPVDSVYCGYQIDDNPPIIQLNKWPILPGESIYFTFDDSANLSVYPITRKIKMFTYYPEDENPLNDTIWKWLTTNIFINQFPYYEDFEESHGWWTTEWIHHLEPGTSWEWGTPNKQYINETATGNKCWVTSLSSFHFAPENSYVLSPCFDFSSLLQPVLEMDIWYNTSNSEYYNVEYSIDSGYTWHRLGNPGEGINWYNTPIGYNDAGWSGITNGWIKAIHKLDGLGGKPYVLLRIVLRAAINSYSEGFAFDNIKIYETPDYDINIIKLVYPYDSCGLSQEKLKILISNDGVFSLNHIPIKITVNDNEQIIYDTIFVTLQPNDTITITTNKFLNLNEHKLYNIKIECILNEDSNIYNNSINVKVMNYPVIKSFPYIEDFEENEGFWYSYGQNNSWEWGIPTDTNLPSVYSGQKLWKTNLNGDHNFYEKSYLESPCFDLSFLYKPKFKTAIFYKLTYPSYVQFEYKTSKDNSWKVLGSNNSPNWYNGAYSWIDSVENWTLVEHSLDTCISTLTKFRFSFNGGIPNTGFAIDLIKICELPKPDFNFNIFITDSKKIVNFFNNSINYTNLLWNFGDGSYSYDNNPTHTYSLNQDSIFVTLTVFNECGIDSITKLINLIGVPDNKIITCFNFSFINNNLIIFNNCQSFNNENFSIEIFNYLGKKIYHKEYVLEKETIININFLKPSVYYLVLKNKYFTYYHKFIVF